MCLLFAGVGLSVLGFSGYATGVLVAYPGRAFALSALTGGLTLAAVGRGTSGEGSA